MKKIVALFMVCVMALSLMVGCGSNKGDDAIKVGAIYINSKDDTSGYTYAHHNGITKAMENLGISSDNLYIIDNVLEDDIAVTNAIDNLAGKGCKIIFGISFGYITAMAEAAEKEEYKDIIFSHATGYLSNDANFNNYFGRIYQARFLAGIAAGLKSLALGNNNIGYVAAWGTEYAETCSGINAFALGAQAVNPDAKLHVKVISTWGDEALEKQAAEYLINTYKCCVIAQHCDSAQPQMAAEAADNVFGCGYNSDMTEQAPTSHLTAPVWNWEVYYELAIKTAMNQPDNFMGVVGNYYGGLKENFIGISKLTDNCEPGTEEIIKLATDLMVSGNWDVFSGVKLSFTNKDGKYDVVTTNADLLDNNGNVIVKAGDASVADSVIQGSMNYYVAGITAE